jgi:uncharacterized alpha/beta hydrolase family protein
MSNDMNKNIFIVIMMMSLPILLITIGSFAHLEANAQQNETGQQETQKPLPVLLIHGYAEDAAIWKKWEDMLKKDGVQFFTVTFKDSDDKCGSA